MNSEVLHSRWQSYAIFKIGNRLYLGANLADLREICVKDAESHADMIYVSKIAIFDGSSRHLKIVFRRLGIYVIVVMNYSYPTYFSRRISFNKLIKTANII